MKIQEATKRETLHIAEGTLVFSVIMNLVFLVLGKWDLTVLWGTLLGGGFAVLNFFLLGLAVQKAASASDEKKGKAFLQSSYSMRMLATVIVGIIGVQVPCFSWAAVVIPLLFPRLTIFAMQLLGVYKPSRSEDKTKSEAEKGDDEPV